eukprot:895678-Prorocentrum_minimum.AAC.1
MIFEGLHFVIALPDDVVDEQDLHAIVDEVTRNGGKYEACAGIEYHSQSVVQPNVLACTAEIYTFGAPVRCIQSYGSFAGAGNIVFRKLHTCAGGGKKLSNARGSHERRKSRGDGPLAGSLRSATETSAYSRSGFRKAAVSPFDLFLLVCTITLAPRVNSTLCKLALGTYDIFYEDLSYDSGAAT